MNTEKLIAELRQKRTTEHGVVVIRMDELEDLIRKHSEPVRGVNEQLEKVRNVLLEVEEREMPCKGEESNCSGCRHVNKSREALTIINNMLGSK